MRSPTQNVGPVGSAVLTFIAYKRENRQAKYIDWYRYNKDLFCQAIFFIAHEPHDWKWFPSNN